MQDFFLFIIQMRGAGDVMQGVDSTSAFGSECLEVVGYCTKQVSRRQVPVWLRAMVSTVVQYYSIEFYRPREDLITFVGENLNARGCPRVTVLDLCLYQFEYAYAALYAETQVSSITPGHRLSVLAWPYCTVL